MSRIIAILGGGDWYDASVEHVEIPDNMDLEKERTAYQEWHRNVYNLHRKPNNYQTFVEFLKSQGAFDSDKVEIFSEY